MEQPKTLILMQGIPGSGKSTLASTLLGRCNQPSTIRSTDEFWGPEYNYDAAKAGYAHKWNQRRVIKDMQADMPTIIVDNTNITRAQVKPYLTMAEIYNYDVMVYRVEVPVELAIARQADRPENRRVPEEVIRSMAAKMSNLLNEEIRAGEATK